MNISMKPDTSFLFSSMSGQFGSIGTNNMNFFSDYACIKNGSYGKLLKAYYAKAADKDSTASSKTNPFLKTDDNAQTLTDIQKDADNLKESADKLIARGTKSLFNEKDVTTTDENGITTTTRGIDMDAAYKAVSEFVSDYNSLIKSGSKASSTSIEKRVNSLASLTDAYDSMLTKAGITVKSDNTLSIDEASFKKADGSTLKSLFNGTGSFAYNASAQASLIDFAASSEASKAKTYDFTGKYGNNYNTGNLFNGYF